MQIRYVPIFTLSWNYYALFGWEDEMGELVIKTEIKVNILKKGGSANFL